MIWEFHIYANKGRVVPDDHYTSGWRWIKKRFGI